MRALANPALGLEQLIVPNGAPLYHTELDYIRRESRADLRFEVGRLPYMNTFFGFVTPSFYVKNKLILFFLSAFWGHNCTFFSKTITMKNSSAKKITNLVYLCHLTTNMLICRVFFAYLMINR